MSMPQAQKKEKHKVPQKRMHLRIKETKKSHPWARWKTSTLDAYTTPSNRPAAVFDRTSGF